MKKALILFGAMLLMLSLALVLAGCQTPDGETPEGGAIADKLSGFNYTVDGGKYTITGIKDKSVSQIVIPYGVTSIGLDAFRGCTALTSITIPDSVTSIGYSAFKGCTGLTSITIPASVTSIDSYAFYGCTGLTNITVSDNNRKYKSIDGNLYTKDGNRLIQYAIGKTEASFSVPHGVTRIGAYAFYGCTGLTSITIPDSVTEIEYYAFSDCTGLTSVIIPDSITSIGYFAFRGCTGLTSITVSDNNTVYKSIDGNLYTKNGNTLIQYAIGKTEASFSVPHGVTSIDSYAFYGCTGLASVTIENGVTSIGSYAFSDCTGLTSVIIPDSVTRIGDYAFWGCTGLVSVTISDSVTSIGEYAFWGCTGLTSVTISDSVTSIGKLAFWGCTGLTSIKYRGSEEEWNSINKEWLWNDNTGSYTIIYNYEE